MAWSWLLSIRAAIQKATPLIGRVGTKPDFVFIRITAAFGACVPLSCDGALLPRRSEATRKQSMDWIGHCEVRLFLSVVTRMGFTVAGRFCRSAGYGTKEKRSVKLRFTSQHKLQITYASKGKPHPPQRMGFPLW